MNQNKPPKAYSINKRREALILSLTFLLFLIPGIPKDFWTYIVGLAGGKLEYEQCGVSLCGVLDGRDDKPREYVLSELSGEIMYMDDEWKMAVNKCGEVYLLFDRRNDPHEQNNLEASEDAGEITNALREKMLKAIMQNQCRIPSVVQQHKAFVN